MTKYPHLLTDGQIDARKVRREAIRRARIERDAFICMEARLRVDLYMPLNHVAVWHRREARKLMVAGATVQTFRPGYFYNTALRFVNREAAIAAANVARWESYRPQRDVA